MCRWATSQAHASRRVVFVPSSRWLPPSVWDGIDMIPNDAFLHNQGPLARVWLAAHWERKLSKTQFLQTSIPSNVDMIVDEDQGQIALRLSGQLLLGFARIYSRKAKYLQDDCSDMLLRIKVAFRGSAVIDLSQEQLHVSRAAITLPDMFSPMDLLMPEPTLQDWGIGSRPRHMARHADITLPDTHYEVQDEEDEHIPLGPDGSILGMSVQGFDLGLVDESTPSRAVPPPKRARRETQRRSDVTRHTLPDLDDSFESVGVARRAPSTEAAAMSEHVQALVGDVNLSADLSLEPLAPMDVGGAADVTTDTVGFDVPDVPMAGTPPPVPSVHAAPRAPSTPSRHLTLDDVAHAELNPHTMARLRTAAQQQAASSAKAPRKRPIQDDVTEIFPARARSLQARAASVARTMNKESHEQHCLPASRVQLAAMADQARGAKTAVPRGLDMAWGAAVEGLDAYMTWDARRAWLATQAFARESEMQLWLHAIHEQAQALNMDEEAFPMEVGRRAPDASPAWPDVMDMDVSDVSKPAEGFDVSDVSHVPLDDMPLPDVPDMEEEPAEPPAPRRSSRRQHTREDEEDHGRLAPLSRMSTPEYDSNDEVQVDVPASNPLVAFDSRAPDTSVHGDTIRTKRAAHVLRTQMGESDTVSFRALSANATRRAAAGFFFEMLVLGTRDCVQLKQDAPYGDIGVRAKPALQGI